MPPKQSGKAQQRAEGLARTDNNLRGNSWPIVVPINQKNYYTEYLKRDDQALVYRQQSEQKAAQESKERQRIRAENGDGDAMDVDETTEEDVDGVFGSKIIVIHPGSRNLRIGLASDALPKTIPNVIARRAQVSESEENDGEPVPKRLKIEADLAEEEEDHYDDEGSRQRRTRGAGKKAVSPEKIEPTVTPVFSSTFKTMADELKVRMRMNKRRFVPNSRDGAIKYNQRSVPDSIKEHNDPHRVEWTDISALPEYIVGPEALRIPDNSKPRYKLFWPIRDGLFNEADYTSKRTWLQDVTTIIREAMRTNLGVNKEDAKKYSVVLVVPDLYDRIYVTEMLELLLKEFQFDKVCIFQESMAATFGAGFSQACIVDIGAQKTSISCIDEGMVIPDSRMNLKYGGDDITSILIRMFLYSSFPYDDINLRRRYDYLLAEELKIKHSSLNEAEVVVHMKEFYLRAPGQETRKYAFKTFDECYLAPMSLFQPEIMELEDKMRGRRNVWDRSHDIYDGSPNDPTSIAQQSLFQSSPRLEDVPEALGPDGVAAAVNASLTAGVGKALAPFAHLKSLETEGTPRTSTAGSPAPESINAGAGGLTPIPGLNGGQAAGSDVVNGPPEARDELGVPILALDLAIAESIKYAAKGDEKKSKDFFTGILVVGGGSLTPGFYHLLEERLIAMRPNLNNIIISVPPRDLDPQVIVWKGASVFGKLETTNDTWIRQQEYDFLGSRVLAYKTMFHFN